MKTAIANRKFDSLGIIGCGFAGLGCAYHAAKYFKKIVIYDSQSGPGINGASAVACGVMHPLTAQGKEVWRGLEGFETSIKLITESQAFSKEKLLLDRQIVRPIFDEDDLRFWQAAAVKNPHLMRVLSPVEFCGYTNHLFDDKNPLGGVLYQHSNIVNSPEYLAALWKNSAKNYESSNWNQQYVSAEDLAIISKLHDHVIVAAGPGLGSLWIDSQYSDAEAQSLFGVKKKYKFKYVSGQRLKIAKSLVTPQITNPVLLACYLIPSFDNQSFICGSTHEHIQECQVDHWNPSSAHAKSILSPQFNEHKIWPSTFPSMEGVDVDSVGTGIRIVSPRCGLGRVPRAARHKLYPNVWMLGGLGSKGLVHHAIVSEALVNAIGNNGETDLPTEMRIVYG